MRDYSAVNTTPLDMPSGNAMKRQEPLDLNKPLLRNGFVVADGEDTHVFGLHLSVAMHAGALVAAPPAVSLTGHRPPTFHPPPSRLLD